MNLDLDTNSRAIAYQFTIGAIGYAFAAEIPTPRLRAPTLSLIGITNGSVYVLLVDTRSLADRAQWLADWVHLPLCKLVSPCACCHGFNSGSSAHIS